MAAGVTTGPFGMLCFLAFLVDAAWRGGKGFDAESGSVS